MHLACLLSIRQHCSIAAFSTAPRSSSSGHDVATHQVRRHCQSKRCCSRVWGLTFLATCVHGQLITVTSTYQACQAAIYCLPRRSTRVSSSRQSYTCSGTLEPANRPGRSNKTCGLFSNFITFTTLTKDRQWEICICRVIC